MEGFARNLDRIADAETAAPLETRPTAKTLKNDDSIVRMESFHDPIAAVLREDAREDYLTSVRSGVRKGLVDGLASTIRWQNGAQMVNPDFRESDLEHVIQLLKWANEIESDYPDLYQEITDGKPEEWLAFLSMMVGHDIGEIVVGDMCLSNPELKKKADRLHKRKEAWAARLMLRKYLSPESGKRHLENYARFEKKRRDDKLVMLGHALDKGQATRNVAKNIIPYNIGNPDYNVTTHWYTSQAVTMQYVVAAMSQLHSQAAKGQLAQFFDQKVLAAFREVDISEINEARLTTAETEFKGWEGQASPGQAFINK